MAYKPNYGNAGYRSSELDEVQGFLDLKVIWTAIRESEKGKRPPLRDEVKAKICKGLKRTMCESRGSRARQCAAAIILAINDRDWDRDVYRKPNPYRAGLGPSKKSKGKGVQRHRPGS